MLTMQFGKSLLGAILGAAVSIGLLIAVYLLLQRDNVWLAIPFALITGLGVRMMVSTTGHASYARGVMTMLIALAAYIGGWRAVSMIATAKANQPLAKPTVSAETEPADGEAKDEATADAPADAPKADQPAATPPRANVAQPRPAPASAFGSPWDVIWLAIAALVAYEMGRGSATSAAPASQSTGAMPAGTHPDA
jgi:hypothetical protein